MKLIDLTHTIGETMPVYPGTPAPSITVSSSHKADGFQEHQLILYSHIGTHIDAPNHVLPQGKTLDQFPLDHFAGKALVIDCSAKQAGEEITLEDLQPLREKADKADFLLFYTGWANHWGTQQYWEAYPRLAIEVIDYLLESKKKGVGLDTCGLDPVSDSALPRHHRLLSSGSCIILENLKNLEKVRADFFTLLAFPLKLTQTDGAPARVVAWLK